MDKLIISISRNYGSGGRAVGIALSEKLGIPYYDRQLLDIAAEQGNINPEIAKQADENIKQGLAGAFSTGKHLFETALGPISDLSIYDKLHMVQTDLIKNLAKQGGCVIIGRCADTILEGDPNLVKLFITADEDIRIKNIMEYQSVNEKEAKKLMHKMDKQRGSYYNYFSDNIWGEAKNYDLTINTKIGIEQTVELIYTYLKMFRGM
ncbi:MAG: cytidylate kinase-like family protein [Clostridia bacterium]|nr:cytidylate kinase-like family protein [Clostridia bacterium]